MEIIGIKKVIVLVNQTAEATVLWSQDRFQEICLKLEKFLKRIGFQKSDISWIPASGLTGTNIIDPSSTQCPWYGGPSLLQALDDLQPFQRMKEVALRLPVYDKYKENGKTYVLGKVETWVLNVGDTVICLPGGFALQVGQILASEVPISCALPGENIKVVVKCSPVAEDQILPGSVLCPPNQYCSVSSDLIGELKILELPESKSLFTAGFPAIFHSGTTQVECKIESLLDVIDPKTRKVIGSNPPFVKENAVVQCRIRVGRPLCLEKFSDFPQLGIARFTLRDEGRTIAFGKIISCVPH